MSTIQTWTLWQRMPPRYQLTSRFYDEDADDLPLSITPEKLLSARSSTSSRPTSGINKQERTARSFTKRPSSGPPTHRKVTNVMSSQDGSTNIIVSTGTKVPKSDMKEQNQSSGKNSQNKFSFPSRKSDYINSFQKQRRVNSARRRLAESPPTPGVGISSSAGVTSPRAQTAHVFPVTDPGSYSTKTIRMDKPTSLTKSKNSVQTTKIDIFQFDVTKSISSSSASVLRSTEKQPTPKRYMIQDTSRSTMYIDSGKVIRFGKSRHDLTQLLKTQSLRRDRNKSFFSELRRDYLTHPKYEFNRNKDKREYDPRLVAYERRDYNRKVENILNYYSDEEGSRAPSPSNSRSSSRYRARSPTGGRVKGLTLTVNAPSRPPSRADSPVNERGEGSGKGDYIKLNKQSKLYDRKFYLRTPVLKHDGFTENQLEDCRCSICKIELQLSIVTGVNKANVQVASSVKALEPNSNGKDERTGAEKDPITDDRTRAEKSDKSSQLKVTFKQPETEEKVQEQHTLTISCTLPEVSELAQSEAASESGFESSRTTVSIT